MTLEGSVAEYMSHMQKRKFRRILHIYEYPVLQEKDDLRIDCQIDFQPIIK